MHNYLALKQSSMEVDVHGKSLEWGGPLVAAVAILLALGECLHQSIGDHVKIATYLGIAIVALLAPKIASLSIGKDGISADLAQQVARNNEKVETTKSVALELDQQLNQKLSQIADDIRRLRLSTGTDMAPADATQETGSDPDGISSPIIHPQDPQKGRFGGQEERDGISLSATVKSSTVDEQWQKVTLRVHGGKSSNLRGFVDFYLHDTFQPNHYRIPVTNNVATLAVRAWGAFTVGALAGEARIPLELDLATSPHVSAPMAWKAR
jgi:hypothetical protein